jgi:hypothetical protein
LACLTITALLLPLPLLAAVLQYVEAKSNKLISRCSRLAVSATPEQQAAARAVADDMAAAVAALRHTAGLDQQQQQGPLAATATGSLGFEVPTSISNAEAFRLSSRPGAKFKIVLDFDGYSMTNTQWNVVQGVSRIVTQPYDKDGNPSSFNADEIAGDLGFLISANRC